MRLWLYTFLIMVVFLLLFLGGALLADAEAAERTNIERASDGLLYAAVDVADEWWAGQGQTPPPVDLFVYDSPSQTVAAWAYFRSSVIMFDRRYVRDTRSLIARARSARAAYQELCMVAIHERGHNLDLRHDVGGIMAPVITHAPVGACVAWSIQQTRVTNVTHSRARKR